MRAADGKTRRIAGALPVWVTCTLIGWSAWARAGTIPHLQYPMPVLALLLLLLLLFERPVQGPPCATSRWQHCRSLLIVVAGLAFLALLAVQWWNSGRDPYFHPFEQRWVFTPPPHPGLPSSVDCAEAAEMLRWFFPAWVILLAFLRPGGVVRTRAGAVAWFLVINAALLSAFGIVQLLSGTSRLFWIVPMRTYFFASFGYENHAASYFPLHAGLAAGLLIRALDRRIGSGRDWRHRRSGAPVVTAAVCMMLCLAGAVLSSSRAGIAFAFALAVFSMACAAYAFWRRFSIAQRVNASLAVVMCAAVFFFTTAAAGGGKLTGAAGMLFRADLPLTLDTRLFFAGAAVSIWKESPWFGTGGWGFRHFAPVYALESGHGIREGYANVHNDALQFLCEFGLAGVALLLVSVTAFLCPLWQALRQRPGGGILPVVAGLGAVLAHSLMDLPFRSPGIMLAWIAVAGVAGSLFRSDDSGRRDP